MDFKKFTASYLTRLSQAAQNAPYEEIQILADSLQVAWTQKKVIYLCGNGGSAGNAIHIANDWIYGAGVNEGVGLRVEALSANAAVLTCLGNDIGYENIFSEQLRVKADEGDILIALSGSGNSPNVVTALELGASLGMKTFAILGFDGGRCKSLAQHAIHFPVDDMQISEDLQLIVGHICMQWLSKEGKK
uniref:SIS domain-containing protein n=1 Tax=Limnohabitans sp. TaxID=1907725 RepID=UPI004048C699